MKKLYCKISIGIFIFCTTRGDVSAQKETMQWIVGYQFSSRGKATPDTGLNQLWGGTVMNFQTNPPATSRIPNSLSLEWAHTSICDTSGNLLFYTNGSKIFNWAHEPIENADTLNYSRAWEGYDSTYYLSAVLGSFPQNTIIIRNPYQYNLYYIVSLFYNYLVFYPDGRSFSKIMYSILDMNQNGGKGKLMVKEKILATGNYAYNVNACKKANGRDWWILIRNKDSTGTGTFNLISIDSAGISINPSKQKLGYRLYSFVPDSVVDYHTGCFSPDGKYFAFTSYHGVELFRYNRCTGMLSQFQHHPYPMGDTSFNLKYWGPTGLSFSSNSKYLYSIYPNRIYQYEARDSAFERTITRVANHDLNGMTRFGTSQLAPDGKIYIGNGDGGPMLFTVIDSPNKKGLGCQVRNSGFNLLTMSAGVPYFPDYDLGPVNCCVFSGNKIPVMSDTALMANDSGSYQWLSCDSAYKPIAGATQKIYKPKKSGNYAVRVSNPYCTDTSACAYLYVKSSISTSSKSEQWAVYPNPVADELVISNQSSMVDYPLSVMIYNMMGRMIRNEQHRMNDKVVLDMRGLANGVYQLLISNERGVLHREKVSVQR